MWRNIGKVYFMKCQHPWTMLISKIQLITVMYVNNFCRNSWNFEQFPQWSVGWHAVSVLSLEEGSLFWKFNMLRTCFETGFQIKLACNLQYLFSIHINYFDDTSTLLIYICTWYGKERMWVAYLKLRAGRNISYFRRH